MSARTSTAKRKQERRIQTSTSGGLWRTEGTKTHEVRPRSSSASPVSETPVEIRRPGATRVVPGWAYRTNPLPAARASGHARKEALRVAGIRHRIRQIFRQGNEGSSKRPEPSWSPPRFELANSTKIGEMSFINSPFFLVEFCRLLCKSWG